ncbi:hypothetical protein S40293_05170 [Stachybotrys chartarum IBT 40293]|nr:hypothetical protein S40293_05170 [Stachybotrys chartarum IBT 40293]
MATSPKPPAEPLLVVLGTTGTGKSELAVELATRFNGEIINTDAMQLYEGLPVITNKMTTAEQRGIPHHLLGHISLEDMPWMVDVYKREAERTIQDIRDRGKLPILVGGTQYYVDPLLFKDVTLGDVQHDSSKSFPILDEPTEVILEELRKVDPKMAEQWHPNDRRKISRSLEIFLQTGRPASEHYAEQQRRKAEAAQAGNAPQRWDKLMLWVFSEREVLNERLDKRIDKMLDAGLLNEVQEMLKIKQQKEAAGHFVGMTKGIWQSIGYRQFEPYAMALNQGKAPSELEPLKIAGTEDMKTATRQYARSQTRWIRLKQVPLLLEQGPEAMRSLYLLDSTDISQFQANVVEPATNLVSLFLRGESRPDPSEISDVAREVLTKISNPPPPKTVRKRTCELCHITLLTDEAWQRHLGDRKHRRMMTKKNRLALVPVESPTQDEAGGASDEDGSGPDLAAIFIA